MCWLVFLTRPGDNPDSLLRLGCFFGRVYDQGMDGQEDLIEQLRHLHVDRSHGAPAPHKPLMLLGVLDLVEECIIEHNRIDHDSRLVERFNDYWAALAPTWLPFFHLRFDGFWELTPRADADKQLATMRSCRSSCPRRV